MVSCPWDHVTWSNHGGIWQGNQPKLTSLVVAYVSPDSYFTILVCRARNES